MSYTRRRFVLSTVFAMVAGDPFTVAQAAAEPPAPSHRIELLGFSFDPLTDGEPAVPPALRARGDSRYALLQLGAAPKRADLDALRAAGVVFHDAIAGNAYLIRLDPRGGSIMAKRAEIATLWPVRWVGALHAAYKISPQARGGLVLVDLFPDANLAAVASEAMAVGAEVIERSEGTKVKLLVVKAGADLLPALAAIDGVRFVQDKPEFRMVNDNARYVVQTNQRGDVPLYTHGLSGAGQVAAISDSGIDAYDFENATGTPVGTDPNDAGCYFIDDGNGGNGGAQIQPSSSHRKVVAYTVPNGATGDYTDESGHGTHVAGSIVGDQEPWGEISPADGQAYNARIFFQDVSVGDVLTVNPPSNYFDDLFAPAYDVNGNGLYDPSLEPRTHSNSWGSPDSTYDASTAQVDQFMWVHPDFLIFYAAGNTGPGPFTVGNPGTAKDIVTVAATQNGNADTNRMEDYSSHGPIPASGPPGANRLSPIIGAPGTLVSASYKTPCGTQELSGTSMATPTTQGVALLMRQYLWDGYYPHGEPTAGSELRNPPPSAALLKALLLNSGERMTGLLTDNGAGGSWPSNGQGWGRIKADDALYFQGDHRDLWVHDEYSVAGTTGFGANGESRTFTIKVGDGVPFETEPLEVTLVWTDYPGSMLDGGRLVNNLNLVVTDPAGGTHRGNDPAQNDFNNATDLPPAPDAVNPWEVVYLANPAPGTYTITVSAATLGSLAPDPGRKQGFAVVATGDLRSSRGRAEIEMRSYDPTPSVSARLRVTDLDRNQSPGGLEFISANISSTTSPAGISVSLGETAADSATFRGNVTLIIPDQGQILGPGQLAVHEGDTIRLTYSDANDGTGSAYVAYDTAKIEGPSLLLLNPPRLADPGATDPDGDYTVSWTAAETSNNRGLTRTLAFYAVEESTNYALSLFDDAEGALETYWTTHAPGGTSTPPWTKSATYNHTPNPPPPGESYWSSGNEGIIALNNNMALTNPLTIPTSVASARLTFYSRFFNEPDDTGNVEITTNNGSTWTPLLVLSDAPSTPPADTRMQHHEIDLTPYIGQPIRIRFRMNGGGSDFFLFVTSGWWVDDVTISGATWSPIASVPATQTQYQVTGRFSGEHSYRVRAVYTDGTASAFSNVEGILVQGAGGPAGRVPESGPGVPLTLGKSGDDLTLQWGASCVATDTDYEIYEGTIGDYTSHTKKLCTTGGSLGVTLTTDFGSHYYLVVPRNASFEGSYGHNSSGIERPAGVVTCSARMIGACP
jgi:subtilase family protein